MYAGPPDPVGAVRARIVSEHGWADLRGPTACEVLDYSQVQIHLGKLGPDPLASAAQAFEAIKSTVEDGAYVIAFNIAAAPKQGFPDTAVNPAWRQTVIHSIMATLWDPAADESVKKAASDKLTFDWMKR